jgi:hypothetical protein
MSKGKFYQVLREKTIYNLLDEAKAEFPQKVFFDHPLKGYPNEPANDAEEFYAWFKKWFGSA